MKKTFTFYDLIVKKRLLFLLFLLLFCNKNFAQTFCRPDSQTNSTGGVLCVGMSVTNPNNAFDSSMTTYASITNTLGLLCFAQETLHFSQTAKAGDQIVIYFGEGNGLLDVDLLANATIQAKNGSTNVGGPVAMNNPLLNLQLLSATNSAVIRYTLPGDANQIQIQSGGLLSVLVSLRIYDVRLQFAKPTITGGETQSICSGQSIALSATAAAGTTLAWYDSPTSTTALSNVGTFTTPALTTTTTYYVSTSRVGDCESDERLPVTINVIDPILPIISSTGTTFCSSGPTQATTLSVENPVVGTTYSWFSVPAGGIALATGTTYSPTVPTGVTTFYVEASIGACKTPTRTAVPVTSTPVPALATVLTQSVSILSGQNATLNASTTEANVVLDWYDVPTGGTRLLENSNTFITPALTATKIYYVESRNTIGGCVSATRVPVTVTVLATPLGTCLEANSQQTTQNGLCLLCSSTTPNNSVDGNIATAARLTLPVGLLNGWIQQTLQFNNPGKAGDIVDVELELPGGITDISLLGAVSLATYNGATYNNDRIFTNNPLVTLQLLSGNRFRASVVAGANFDRVEIRLGGVVTALTSLDIYQATYRYKAPVISGNKTICSGTATTLTATLDAGETISWYDAATAGTLLSSTDAYTTPALTANTTYYVEITRNGCVNSERNPVIITITDPVLPTISTTGTTICSSGPTQATTLSVANPVAGTTYSWYDVQTGGVALATGTTYTPTVPTGVTTFYVEASIGACSSSTRTTVTVTSTPIPALATVLTQSVSILSGQNATLNASTTEANVVLDWYDVPTDGTKLLGDSNTFTTPILTATKTYYVESRNTVGGCVSATRVPVTVTVLATPLGTCLEANSQQTTQNGLCLLCSSATPNNSVDGNIATAARLTLPVGLLNGWIQQTLQFNNPGKAGDIVDVELELPGGIADLSLLGAVSLATYNGSTYNGDRVFLNNSLVTLQLLSGNRFKASIVAGANFNRVEIRLGGIVTALTSLDIYQATYRYKAPVISGNKTICSGTTTLTASLDAGETISWYDAATAGTLLSSTANYTTPALTANTTYYVELTRNGCINSERNPITITVTNPVAPATVVASPLNVCSGGTTTIVVQSPVVGTIYNWYDAATGGNLLFTGTSYTTPSLSASITYHVEAVIGTCLSPTRTSVPVNVNPRPSVPVPTSSNVIIQSGQTVTLSVATTSGITYDWYDAPTGGNLLQPNSSTYTTPTLNTNRTFYVQARSSSDCTSSTRAAINVIVISTVSTCLQPSTEAVTVDPGLLCVLCNGSNTGNSIDGNANTFASLTITAGVLNSYIQQELTFATPGQTGDIIDVILELPGGLADIALLGSVSIGTSNGGVANPGRLAVNNSLLNLQVLSGNKFKVSYPATAAFNRVDIRLGALVGLLTTLRIYDASYRFPNATITGAAAPICSGGTATLSASSTGTETFAWYDAPTGGNIVAVNPTLSLTSTTTYYLEAARGTCINSVRQPVTVNVLDVPTDANITIASPLTASCGGGIVLAPTSALAGATFKYYTDQNKTVEITSGTVGGVTYVKDGTTGALTISGLIAANAPYTYYVSVLNGGVCENINGTLKEVVVNYPTGSALTVQTPLVRCGKANLKDAITNFDVSGNTTYTFFDPSNNPITDLAAENITVTGIYSIQAQTAGVDCPSVKLPVTVTVNPLPTLTGVTSSVVITKGSSAALAATSNGTITWYDPQGNPLPSNNTGVLSTVGIYTYTVIASNGSCTTSQTVTISVIDPVDCDVLLERVYANSQSSDSIITGVVTNGTLGADGNPSTYSTITTGLGLLGIGTTWQNLQWPTTIPKGTPVTVKLGLENSVLAVGQNVSVVGTKRDGSNNPIDIGVLQSVSGSLLNLLPGQNSFEYTFVPSNGSGPQDYDGIRVQLGSILSVAQNVNVYDAYYKKQVTQIACGQGDIEDVFSGVRDLGVGALTSTVGVSNPFNVADGDVSTYATMFTGVGVLAAAELTATFRTPSMVGDSLRITISKPQTVLTVGLLGGFTIQLYSGNIAVGGPIQSNSSLLTLKLLSGDTMAMTIISPQTQPYDKVVITFGGAATLIDQLRVHTIDRVTNTKVNGSDDDNNITACPGQELELAVDTKACANYVWYDSPTGGNVVANGQTFTLPATLAAGTYKYYIQPIRYGCPALERGEVTVVIGPTTPATAIANVTINGGNNTIICSESGTVTLDAFLSGTPALTNPVYHWYSFNGTTQTALSESTAKLELIGLAPGTYTYYVGVSSTQFCATAPADRKLVTFTILPSSLETDIVVDNASICHNTVATLTPTSTLANPVYFWYLDANKTQPVFTGVIGGVSYTISGTGVLTAAGLTTAMSPMAYYVAVSSDNTCQNKNGELKVVTVTVNDPETPTTTDSTQDFCQVSNPTIANLQVNEANVVWYNIPSGGTALATTTALANGPYYAGILDPITGCESSVRLLVTVTVTDPGTPIITDTTQEFCLVNAPTFASIDVSPATNIVWYDALNGGNLIASTATLTSGTYYAAIKDPITTCESSVRLAITISVTDPGTPIITDTTQEFCLVNAPTFASINVSPATNIVWYDALTGGNLIPSTTVLTSGTYYAAIKDPTTTCESNVRLAISISVTDPGTPVIADTDQEFCLVNAPTFSTINVSPAVAANIVWYTALVGGTVIPSTTVLTSGTYYAAIKDPATTCESNVRLAINISVTDPGTPIINRTTQEFCVVNAPTFASIDVSPATNIVWYDALTGGNLIASTATLTSGTYYAAIKDPTTTCESNVRLAINISVTDPGTPVITDTTQEFCLADAPTFASINVSPATNIVWYDAITGGNLIPVTTVLTSGTYYAAIKDPITTCESIVRLAININVTDPGTPTLVTAGTQNFCLIDAPTFASVQLNEANIVWYDSLSGGTLIPATATLTSGVYFAVIKDPTTGCESATRLSVTISVTDPGTPTLVTAGTQNFCLADAPTFASIQLNEANIVWYTALTGGTVIPSTNALTSGTYFVVIKDPTTGCESAVRLSVTISVTDPGTPTLVTAGTQSFCLIDAPTFASIQLNEANIVWYTALTGGTVIPSTNALTSGTYFAVIKDPTTGCESAARLSVTINVADPGTPTLVTAGTQNFCLIDAPTFASIQLNEANIVWYTALTGGTVIPSTNALTSGTYFAVIKDPITGCESAARLSVTINVTDPGTPTLVTAGTQNFCLADAPTFASVQLNEANIVWYTALTGGTVIPSTNALTSGTYFAVIKDPTTGCESATRLSVTISVTDPGTPTLVTAGTQSFCLIDAPTFASIQLNEANIVWYTALTGGTVIPSTNTLTSGTYFAVIKDPTTGCESAARLSVTINVTDPGTPTLVTAGTQNFCVADAPTFASVQFNEANIVWYTALTGGTVIPSTNTLTSGTYFAVIKDPITGCESVARLSVTISVTDPGTPTLVTAGTQNFCLADASTFASVQLNEANIVWYTALTGGTVIPSTNALTSGTYFAVIKDPATGCESAVRLSVTISVTDPGTPTLVTAGTQNFCLADAPTFASIQLNEANIVWYTALTGGTVIPSTNALTSGTYFAVIKDPTTGCESAARLSVTINVTDPGTPTLVTAGTQNFCLADAPTFASIQLNEANIVWYTALTGGTVIPSTNALTSGTYFAVIKDPITGCESAARLSVTISVTDPGTPTLVTAGTQNFCLADAPTFASVQLNEANIVWYTALIGGTVIPSTNTLTSGTYFAVIKDPITGCESTARLSVTISVTDPGTPTLVTAGTQNFCLIDAPTFASVQLNEANIVWYDSLSGGTLIPATATLTSGVYFAVIKDPTTGCESAARLSVTINVTDPGTPTLVTAGTQNFCLADAPTFASIQLNEANIVWYTALTGGTVILSTNALTSGTYFAVIKDPTTGCESAARLSVTISVTDPGTPTLVTAGTQNFCLADAPTFASVQLNEANIVWYTALTGGTVIPSTNALTSGTYFAVIKDPATGCESTARLSVTISVTDPATPTTTALAQAFCSENNPTVGDIQVNESNVVWYTALTGGTAIASTTALVNGDYYAALKDATTGCESSIRLKVTVTVGSSNTPTTDNVAQSFCINIAPTFANIQVNESNVVWFSSASGGTPIPTTTTLTSGIYFGEITDAVTGCKSATRLQVTITIVNPAATPTTNSGTQNFCTLNTSTVADIQVNEANVIWYSTATGGTALPATTALVTGTYYGAVASTVSCENPVRLAVVVNVNVPRVVTTPRTTQTFCLSKLPTLVDILVNETDIVWYSSATGGTPLAANTQLTAGTYYATALNNTTNGCASATRLGVTINFEDDALVQLASSDDTPCVFQGVTYSIANGKSNYVWSVTNGTITSGGGNADGSATISWSDVGPGTVTVTYTNNCDETTTKSLNVVVATCSDLTITNTVNNPKPNFGEQVTFTVTVNNVGEGNFINTVISDLLPSGYDLVSTSTTSGTYDPTTTLWTIPTLNAGQSVTLTIVAEVLPAGDYLNVATIEISTPLDVDATNNTASASVEPVCLTVYNEFTPNNDGTNDLFRIDCIESYPNNELKVYNRYGALVYSKQHYENDWNGTANVSGVINRGDMLPTGTYFYVIDIGNGTVKKGWLSIMR
ncbi:Ig-like domain-containing protein [Flavobacterium saccharophilum]|uniref:Gliding motility-associated C-terminal domain-containing protein n=1 Tax=Flavobacterium saccharophilum TaxID=29534 RepID=A0A1M7DVE9_9FLAO|nr:gliding motility-associated C-terminal domain-containing protein [Flavobacterium saccharophilum]SHL83475.1 gliding motility-associated C-terminal domain-containing protein [Flavobacterium saccharophilum]